MKILSILSVILSSLVVPTSQNIQYVEWYAQVLTENVCFYKTAQNSNDVYFILEPTYFVKLLSDENETFYKAEYLNITGYVKKSEVQVVKNKPATPYLTDINFRVFLECSQIMRSAPSSSNNQSLQIAFIPIYTNNVQYIGKIKGEEAILERTNIWYYCKYTTDKEYFGYVYSEGCDKLTSIKKNTETCEYIDAPDFTLKIEPDQLTIISSSSFEFKILLIIVSVPVAIFLLMLIRSNIILKIKKEKAKEVKPFFDC